MAFALYAYQDGKPTARNSTYYKSRFAYYASLLTLAGISQFFIGIYVMLQFERTPLVPPIQVAVYTITYSEISIAVGGFQLVMGFWGIIRRFGIFVGGKNDHSYSICAFFMWLGMLGAQILTQVAYQPGDDLAPVAPSYACLYLGISIMSPYLDYKVRITPEEFPPGYFGIKTSEFGDNSRLYSAQEEALRAYDSQVAPMIDETYDEQGDDDDAYEDNNNIAHDDIDADFEDDISAPSTEASGGMNP